MPFPKGRSKFNHYSAIVLLVHFARAEGIGRFALSYCSHFTDDLILNSGVILFHQSNRTRESWAGVAGQLAAAGIDVLTIDSRGHGESGGTEGGRKSRPPD
ncbi:MAG: hypothetical protein DME46_02920, partial [Verrucomicrobia bacterium]